MVESILAHPASIIEALARAHRWKRQLEAGKFISVADLPHEIEDVPSDALLLTARPKRSPGLH
jgi:hypothetical protein